MRSAPHVVAAAAGLAVCAGSLLAGPVEVIYCKKSGTPKAAVPGAVDLSGNPEAVEWKAMEDLAVSPDGSRWIVRARTTAASDHQTGIVNGQAATGSMLVANAPGGPYVIQAGRPAPFGASADWIDFIPTGFGRFDDTNHLVFGIRARTTQSGATSSPDANRVITLSGSAATLAFKQGDLYTGMVDIPAGNSGDETVGNSVGSYHLLNDGRVGSHDTTIGNISSLRRPAVTYSRAMFQEIDVSTVTSYDGTGSVLWEAMDGNGFYTTPSGAHWWLTGRHTNSLSGPRVLVYDGRVRVEQGQLVPGSSMVAGDVFQVFMAGNGDYMARGRDNSGTTSAAPDWAIRNGALIAKSGDPITPGSGEHWGDTFLAVVANRVGDYVIIGNTDAAGTSANEVAVLNGTQVVMREGDPVDLDGNGVFDDNAFIGRGDPTLPAFGTSVTGGTISWWLTDDRTLFGLLNLRDGQGNDINTTSPGFGTGQAFIRKTLGAACYANCDNSTSQPMLNVADFTCFLQKFSLGDPYANCDASTANPTLNVADFTCFLQKFALGCP
jgi:hypothetical protein